MNELIAKLIAIKETAKAIHYFNIGYESHLLADRIANGIDEYIDSLKELVIGDDEYPLTGIEYLQKAIEIIPDIKQKDNRINFIKLYELITETLTYIQTMELDRAQENLIGAIAEKLKNNKGLINLQIS